MKNPKNKIKNTLVWEERSMAYETKISTSSLRIYILLWETFKPFVELLSLGRCLMLTVRRFERWDCDVEVFCNGAVGNY